MAFSPLDIPYGALDTKTDERMLPSGALLVAENCTSQTVGGYAKRYGYSALATLPTTPLVRLAARGKELLALTRSALYCYEGPTVDNWRSPLQQTAGAITSSRLPSAQVSQSNIYLDQAHDVTVGSRATSTATGVTVHAFNAFTFIGLATLTIRCVDASGVIVATTSVALATTAAPPVIHCVAAGNYVLVLWSTTGGSLSYLRVDTSALSFGAATAYQTLSAVVPFFDATPVSATSCLIAFNSNTPNVRVALFNIATLTTTAGPTVQSADVLDGGLSVAQDGGTFGMVAWHSVAGGGVRGACFNATTTANTVANFTIDATTAPLAPNTGLVYSAGVSRMYCVWDRAANGTTKQFVAAALVSSAGAVTSLSQAIYNVGLASKPVVDPTAADSFFPLLLNVWAPHSEQQTYFTLRVHTTAGTPSSTFSPMAMHAYRGAYSAAVVTGQLTDVDVYSSTAIAFSASIAYKFLSTNTPRAGWATFTCDLGAATMMSHVQALGSTYIAGGHGAVYDGTTIREMNFLLAPDITVATAGAVGSGGMDNGTYSYRAVFEASDANGNTDRSTPSIAIAATTTAGAGLGKVTLTIDLCPSRIGQSVNCVATGVTSIFRTTANGDVYRFVGTAGMAMGAGSGSVTYVDQANDSTITSNRLLYSNDSDAGAVVEREPPLPAVQFLLHRNRIWGISAADRKVLFYSGELQAGESPWFSSLQQVRIEAGGDITAIASMDDKLIVFKSDLVFKIYGNGLNGLGTSNDLSDPALMTGDAGCLDFRSVVAANGGLLFLSDKGLYGISRGEEISYVGQNADTYWINYANIVSAQMMPDRQEVRFEVSGGTGVADALTGTPIAAQKLVYNYATGQWTTHRNYQDATAIDARVVGGVYYWATAAGVVYKESASSFLDPSSTFVRMLLRTGWIKPSGFQGWNRVQRAMHLGVRKTGHSLTVRCENDYVAGTVTATKTWTDAQLATLPREQVNLHLVRQKGEAYRFTAYDGQDGTVGTGEGSTMHTLQLLAQALRGTFEKKLLAAARG